MPGHVTNSDLRSTEMMLPSIPLRSNSADASPTLFAREAFAAPAAYLIRAFWKVANLRDRSPYLASWRITPVKRRSRRKRRQDPTARCLRRTALDGRGALLRELLVLLAATRAASRRLGAVRWRRATAARRWRWHGTGALRNNSGDGQKPSFVRVDDHPLGASRSTSNNRRYPAGLSLITIRDAVSGAAVRK
jgi:hypothetical protein